MSHDVEVYIDWVLILHVDIYPVGTFIVTNPLFEGLLGSQTFGFGRKTFDHVATDTTLYLSSYNFMLNKWIHH